MDGIKTQKRAISWKILAITTKVKGIMKGHKHKLQRRLKRKKVENKTVEGERTIPKAKAQQPIESNQNRARQNY